MEHVESPAIDEAELVTGLRAGDPKTFEQIVRQYGPRLLSTTRRILNNDEDARDAVQDAFISAFRARAQFAGDAKISTWLHRIAVNAALTRLRSRQRKAEDALDDLLPQFQPNGHYAEKLVAWNEPADVRVSRRETSDLVRRAIEDLPDSYRTVLMLRDIEGLSTEEAAQMLQITTNAVKLRLHRARLALRALLAPHFQGAAA
jgi:RNA polymerase sigma-70 factor (ECF subfamily)